MKTGRGMRSTVDGSSDSGAAVVQVLSGGPAAQAGLAAGDVIVSLAGQPVDSPTTLTNLMDRHHPGDTVDLHWRDRSQREQSASIRLATGPTG